MTTSNPYFVKRKRLWNVNCWARVTQEIHKHWSWYHSISRKWGHHFKMKYRYQKFRRKPCFTETANTTLASLLIWSLWSLDFPGVLEFTLGSGSTSGHTFKSCMPCLYVLKKQNSTENGSNLMIMDKLYLYLWYI